jgi:hypothetical protein
MGAATTRGHHCPHFVGVATETDQKGLEHMEKQCQHRGAPTTTSSASQSAGGVVHLVQSLVPVA